MTASTKPTDLKNSENEERRKIGDSESFSAFSIKNVTEDLQKFDNSYFAKRKRDSNNLSSDRFPLDSSSDWPSVASEIESWLEKSKVESNVMDSFVKETLAKDISSLRQAIGDLIRTASFAMPD